MEIFYLMWNHLTDEAKEEFLDFFEMDSSDITNPPNNMDIFPLAEIYRPEDLDEEDLEEMSNEKLEYLAKLGL